MKVSASGETSPRGHAAISQFPDFCSAVSARLAAGAREYGDVSFARPPAELLGEIEQELLDVFGWGFILWWQLQEIRRRLPAGPPAA
jgi:hypothetical protein